MRNRKIIMTQFFLLMTLFASRSFAASFCSEEPLFLDAETLDHSHEDDFQEILYDKFMSIKKDLLLISFLPSEKTRTKKLSRDLLKCVKNMSAKTRIEIKNIEGKGFDIMLQTLTREKKIRDLLRLYFRRGDTERKKEASSLSSKRKCEGGDCVSKYPDYKALLSQKAKTTENNILLAQLRSRAKSLLQNPEGVNGYDQDDYSMHYDAIHCFLGLPSLKGKTKGFYVSCMKKFQRAAFRDSLSQIEINGDLFDVDPTNTESVIDSLFLSPKKVQNSPLFSDSKNHSSALLSSSSRIYDENLCPVGRRFSPGEKYFLFSKAQQKELGLE